MKDRCSYEILVLRGTCNPIFYLFDENSDGVLDAREIGAEGIVGIDGDGNGKVDASEMARVVYVSVAGK
tara:strand:- start:181 stop:387 length:207 start_codon:yes stop_codon:yes gene_type:complete